MKETRQDESNGKLPTPNSGRKSGISFDRKLIQPELFPELCDPEIGDSIEKLEPKDSNAELQISKNSSPATSKKKKLHLPNPEQITDSVGQILSQTREDLNLTVEEVARNLHLQTDSLRLIENNEFNRLPLAAVYVKSHLKSLCQFYALDDIHILQLYEKTVSQLEPVGSKKDGFPPQTGSLFVQDLQGKDQKSLTKPIFRKFAWIFATILIFGAIILFVLSVRKSNPKLNGWAFPKSESKDITISEKDLELLIIKESLPFRELPTPNQD